MIRIILLLLISNVFISTESLAAKIKIQTLMEVPEFNFYIESVVVVQEEQYIIGHRFNHDKLTPFELEGERIDLMLQNLFQFSFPYQEEKRKLILKVNRIIYNTFDQSAEFGANITFIEKVNGQLIDLATVRVSWVNENTLSNFFRARARGDNLVRDLEFFFLEFLEQEAATKETGRKMVSASELSTPITRNAANFPILANLNPDSKGVFLSFEDFLNANVTEDKSLKLEKVALKKSKYDKLKVESNQFNSEEIWGVYDGENFYIAENEQFGRLVFVDNRFILHAPSTSQGKIDRMSRVISLSTMATLLVVLNQSMPFGQALLISMPIGLAVDLASSYVINNKKSYVYYELDLLTGLINQIEMRE